MGRVGVGRRPWNEGENQPENQGEDDREGDAERGCADTGSEAPPEVDGDSCTACMDRRNRNGLGHGNHFGF